MDQKKIAVRAFAEGIMEDIKEYLPPEYADMECGLTETGKLNGVKKIGICFQMPEQKFRPVIYMEEFYDDVRNGKPLAEIKRAVADVIMENAINKSPVISYFPINDFYYAKDYLSIQLVNTKANREMLSSMPHKEVEDLSLFFTLNFKDRKYPDQIGSIKVTNRMMEQWGIDSRELYHAAMQSVSVHDAPVLKCMDDLLAEMFAGTEGRNIFQEQTLFNPEIDAPFILTNREGMYGASAMFYPGVMEKIDILLPQGFYILPSSTHEILIIPKDESIDAKELGNMVREVNQTALVAKEEFLSDRVYEYDKEQKKIRQVPESIKKERVMER